MQAQGGGEKNAAVKVEPPPPTSNPWGPHLVESVELLAAPLLARLYSLPPNRVVDVLSLRQILRSEQAGWG